MYASGISMGSIRMFLGILAARSTDMALPPVIVSHSVFRPMLQNRLMHTLAPMIRGRAG